MTGINTNNVFISDITLGMLQDCGYDVNFKSEFRCVYPYELIQFTGKYIVEKIQNISHIKYSRSIIGWDAYIEDYQNIVATNNKHLQVLNILGGGVANFFKLYILPENYNELTMQSFFKPLTDLIRSQSGQISMTCRKTNGISEIIIDSNNVENTADLIHIFNKSRLLTTEYGYLFGLLTIKNVSLQVFKVCLYGHRIERMEYDIYGSSIFPDPLNYVYYSNTSLHTYTTQKFKMAASAILLDG